MSDIATLSLIHINGTISVRFQTLSGDDVDFHSHNKIMNELACDGYHLFLAAKIVVNNDFEAIYKFKFYVQDDMEYDFDVIDEEEF